MIARLIDRFRAWRFWRQVRAEQRRDALAAIDANRDRLSERSERDG